MCRSLSSRNLERFFGFQAVYGLAMRNTSQRSKTSQSTTTKLAPVYNVAGADISTVQKLMGCSSADTTVGYDRRGERAKREAVRKLHVPYQRRYTEAS